MSPPADTETLRADLEQLRKDLASLAESVKDSAGRQVQSGIDMARNRADDVRGEIKAYPFTSIFTAFGAGLVLGKLISR